MRVRIDAQPGELEAKSDRLIASLAKALGKYHPEAATILEKAATLPRKEQILKFPVTRELERQTTAAYERQLELMLKDIAKVLDQAKSRKSVLAKSTPADFTKPISEAQDRALARVKNVLRGKGYTEVDYEPQGRLYGLSINELIDLARS